MRWNSAGSRSIRPHDTRYEPRPDTRYAQRPDPRYEQRPDLRQEPRYQPRYDPQSYRAPDPSGLRPSDIDEVIESLHRDEQSSNIRFADFRIPQAATIVLRESNRPLHVSEIFRRLSEGGFEFRGQHQLITLAVSLSRSKRFRKVAPGTFELDPAYQPARSRSPFPVVKLVYTHWCGTKTLKFNQETPSHE
jgi:hypothetical protein